MKNWNNPNWLEAAVKDRDKKCVYCGNEFSSCRESKKSQATWEHIINDERVINRENIARCCFSGNSSKGNKKLNDWLESDYCKKRGINKDTGAEVVRKALVDRFKVSNGSAQPGAPLKLVPACR